MINLISIMFIITLLSSFCGTISEALDINNGGNSKAVGPNVINVGVILDLDSKVGELARDYIALGLSDFYTKHANYKTRLALSLKDSKNDVVVAASAALDLIKEEDIHAIIGPLRSSQAKFVITLGEKAKIPVISFSATSPSLSPSHNHFFVRTAQDDSSQVRVIASIVQRHGWHKVVLIYEDTEYGNGLIPYLIDAFQDINAQFSYRAAISPSSRRRSKIAKELAKIMARETRVLLVHMTVSLGSELFKQAMDIGMMNEGFAWITTNGLSNLLDPIDSNTYDSMQGVIGVRPYLPMSRRLKDFKVRLKRSRIIADKSRTTKSMLHNNKSEINLFGLWAYDTIWALARAVEMVAKTNSSTRDDFRKNTAESELLGLRASEYGPMLLKMLERSKFEGLSGEFHLRHRQMKPAAYEITNVIGKGEKVVGHWTASEGIVPSSELANSNTSLLDNGLKQIIWPGLTKIAPRGWVVPIVGQKLKIGVPVTSGFREFFKVEWDPNTNEPIFSGYSYDMFMATLAKMPFAIPYKFIPYANSSRKMAGTYDKLLYEIKLKNYDAVVGDITITANRTSYVDFTLPYLNSGLSMVVKIKDDERKNIWIFLKPLSWDLWLTTGCAFVFTGFVVWIFEHRTNGEFRGPPNQQLGIIFWFSFSTLVFAHREKVVNNWSRFVLIIWIFVVLILTQSYTASLASMLTVQRLQPSVVDVDELIRNGDFVGYQGNSFVREFLIKELKFNESKLRAYSNPDEYREALSRGSKHGGVGAIFDEIPYIRLFLAKYCSEYTMVGPTYKSDGFGFAFPLGSPLVSYISRAILDVTEDHKKMRELERKYFGDPTICEDQSSKFSTKGLSLSVYSFGGLFIITGLASGFSCLIYLVKFYRKNWSVVSAVETQSSIWSRVITMAKRFDTKDNQSQDLNDRTERNETA